jgi:hypothetical protein
VIFAPVPADPFVPANPVVPVVPADPVVPAVPAVPVVTTLPPAPPLPEPEVPATSEPPPRPVTLTLASFRSSPGSIGSLTAHPSIAAAARAPLSVIRACRCRSMA